MAGPTRGGPDDPLGDDDVQARWAEITEQLGELETPPAGAAEPGAAAATDVPGAPPSGPRDYVAEDEDDGFEQPDPGPLTFTDPVVTLGWAIALGSAIALIVAPLMWRPLPGTVLTLLLAGLVAGAALLLWRMPRSGDRDPGDRGGGAVV